LQFFQSVINTYIGPKFLQVISSSGCNWTSPNGNVLSSACSQYVPYGPADFLNEAQYNFPIISGERIKEDYTQPKSRYYYEIVADCQFCYIMPPIGAAQIQQIASLRSAVTKVILDRLELGYDPSYNPTLPSYNPKYTPYQNGPFEVWKACNIDQVKCLSSHFCQVENPKNIKTFFPTLVLDIEVKERRNYVIGSYPSFTQITTQINIEDGYAPDNFNIINLQTNLT
jgi:hypothetical protein